MYVCVHATGSDVFSTSTDGQVLLWDIRKLVEPVETLPLEFAGYKADFKLGGIVVEYESTMVRSTYVYVLLKVVHLLVCVCVLCVCVIFFQPTKFIGWYRARCDSLVQSKS